MAMWNSKGEKVSKSEELRTLVKERFRKVANIIERAVKAKNTYRARLIELDGDLNKATYSAEHLAKLKEDAAKALVVVNAELYAEFTPRLEELQTALEEAHSLLDLASPELANAVTLIKSVGQDLESENILKINAPFIHDQAALRILQAAYKSSGIIWDGGLDQQVYNAGDAIRAISGFGERAFIGQGSLNALAGAVGKIAKLEGLEFDTLPDPAAVDEAFRTGAGLSG